MEIDFDQLENSDISAIIEKCIEELFLRGKETNPMELE